MEKFKRITRSTKEFVVNHRATVATVTTVLVMSAVARSGQAMYKNYLDDRGLNQDFINFLEQK